jgi:hypothetical protein
MKEPRSAKRAGSREESVQPGTSPEPAPAQAVLKDPSGLADISSRGPGESVRKYAVLPLTPGGSRRSRGNASRNCVGNSRRSSSSAAASALQLEPEYPAESAVDVVHEGYRQLTGRCLDVGLVEGDERSDVDN